MATTSAKAKKVSLELSADQKQVLLDQLAQTGVTHAQRAKLLNALGIPDEYCEYTLTFKVVAPVGQKINVSTRPQLYTYVRQYALGLANTPYGAVQVAPHAQVTEGKLTPVGEPFTLASWIAKKNKATAAKRKALADKRASARASRTTKKATKRAPARVFRGTTAYDGYDD